MRRSSRLVSRRCTVPDPADVQAAGSPEASNRMSYTPAPTYALSRGRTSSPSKLYMSRRTSEPCRNENRMVVKGLKGFGKFCARKDASRLFRRDHAHEDIGRGKLHRVCKGTPGRICSGPDPDGVAARALQAGHQPHGVSQCRIVHQRGPEVPFPGNLQVVLERAKCFGPPDYQRRSGHPGSDCRCDQGRGCDGRGSNGKFHGWPEGAPERKALFDRSRT